MRGGWVPSAMLCVCNTDPEKGAGPTELFVEVYKTIKVNGEHVTVTGIAPLNILRNLKENGVFTESYIQALYGKSTEEMLKEGTEAAEQIWRQKHPENSSNSSVVEKDGSDHERPSISEVSPKVGSTAVKAAEVGKPIDTNRVETNEPVREPVEMDKTGIGSPALVMTKKEVPASIGAIKVNGSVGLLAVEPAKKPAVGIKKVGADKASAAPADLPAAKSVENPVVEKSMETNEANADMLLEDFKSVMNDFEKDTEENNGKFFAKVQYITGELNRFRGLIKYNPTAAMNDPVISEMITSEPDRIRNLEDSRAEDANEFKNNIKSLLESLKSKIENDDERRRLVKITEYVGQMGKDNVVLGDTTNNLLDKLIRIRRYIEGWQNDRWGADGYKSNISQVIGEIISDLSTASGHRQNIVDGIKRIKSEGYYQER